MWKIECNMELKISRLWSFTATWWLKSEEQMFVHEAPILFAIFIIFYRYITLIFDKNRFKGVYLLNTSRDVQNKRKNESVMIYCLLKILFRAVSWDGEEEHWMNKFSFHVATTRRPSSKHHRLKTGNCKEWKKEVQSRWKFKEIIFLTIVVNCSFCILIFVFF